uniref:Spondin domain-containing protein n=2 Tax=Rhodosorus marinus TaxID=101924 RepID=A0A7S2ZH42_9RHOD|mmetsp:Transcript_18808/g.75460  ORF Transcript_18808/g.75460 Transcript_18808/m.75460 type:complete len:228 (+) Transcript_18808:751-1434(+)
MVSKIMIFVAAALAVCAMGSEVAINDAERASKKCSGKAIYLVQIDYLWTGATHPFAYPDNGYFSPTAVASHGNGFHLWTPHGYSTRGVENVAERGRLSILLGELAAQKGRNVFDFVYTEERTEDGSETVKLLIKLDYTRPYVSGISMLTPSPDWFTGFDDALLCVEGKWVKQYERNLSVWDAGTDKGEDFESPNRNQFPRRPIVSILGSRFNSVPVGTVKIIRKRVF